MADPAARGLPHVGRVPGVSRLCDRGLRRQCRSIALTTPAWIAALLTTKITCWINSNTLQTAVLVEEIPEKVLFVFLDVAIRFGIVHSCENSFSTGSTSGFDRDAESINGGFLAWLDQRREPGASLLRLSQLLRCPCAVQASRRGTHTASVGSRETRDELRIVYETGA